MSAGEVKENGGSGDVAGGKCATAGAIEILQFPSEISQLPRTHVSLVQDQIEVEVTLRFPVLPPKCY